MASWWFPAIRRPESHRHLEALISHSQDLPSVLPNHRILMVRGSIRRALIARPPWLAVHAAAITQSCEFHGAADTAARATIEAGNSRNQGEHFRAPNSNKRAPLQIIYGPEGATASIYEISATRLPDSTFLFSSYLRQMTYLHAWILASR